MQFTVINNSSKLIAVFYGNKKLTSTDLAKILKPADFLNKAVYENYWKSTLPADMDVDFYNYLTGKIGTNLAPMGFAANLGDTIGLSNLVQIPQYIYVFWLKIEDKTAGLYLTVVPAALYSTSNVPLYTYELIFEEPNSPNILATPNSDDASISVSYTDPGTPIHKSEIGWVPQMPSEQPESHPWLYAIGVLSIILIVMVIIAIVFAVLWVPSRSTTLNATHNVTEVKTKKQVYLD